MFIFKSLPLLRSRLAAACQSERSWDYRKSLALNQPNVSATTTAKCFASWILFVGLISWGGSLLDLLLDGTITTTKFRDALGNLCQGLLVTCQMGSNEKQLDSRSRRRHFILRKRSRSWMSINLSCKFNPEIWEAPKKRKRYFWKWSISELKTPPFLPADGSCSQAGSWTARTRRPHRSGPIARSRCCWRPKALETQATATAV